MDSGEITAHALERNNSAAAKIVRSAVPLAGLLAYCVLIACNVRRVYGLELPRASSIAALTTSSGVPSRDPPSALMIAALSRGKNLRMPA